jgi:TrmH family RNA methyltransferase
VLTNPRSDRVRSVRALARRSVRQRQGLFLAEGPQAVREAVTHRPDVVRDLYVDETAADRYADLLAAARNAGLPTHDVSSEVLAAMCDTRQPQGLAAVCRPLDVELDAVLAPRPGFVVVLTHVRDPGNAGTVIRGADAAGAAAVLVSDASVDVYNPKVVRSTAGSLFHLPLVLGIPVDDLLSRLRAAGLLLLAADGSGDTLLADAPLDRRHAWVMGNEAWGLHPEVRERCDHVVRVPIYGLAESLNLAMAATVCLYASAVARSAVTPVGR